MQHYQSCTAQNSSSPELVLCPISMCAAVLTYCLAILEPASSASCTQTLLLNESSILPVTVLGPWPHVIHFYQPHALFHYDILGMQAVYKDEQN